MPGITPSNATYELVNLTLNALALCNEGSNSRAHILLAKSKPKGEQSMTFEELLASLKPEQAELIKSHIATEKGTLEQKVVDLEKKVATPVPAVPQPAKTEEDILKSASPELKAAFEKMQGLVDGLVKEKADQLAETRYAKCKAIPVEEATLKEVLKAASPAMLTVLEAAAAAISKTTLGSTGAAVDGQMTASTMDAAYAQLDTLAKSIQTATPALTYEQAFAKACVEKPDLYTKYSKGGN